MKMNKKGFTLIEMLVVIAIIAVLVSIVIPVVSSATDKAAAATDAANLRSMLAEATTDYLAGVANTDGFVSMEKDATTGAWKFAVTASAPKCKTNKDWDASITFDANGNLVAAFGEYTLNDFQLVAENGGELSKTGSAHEHTYNAEGKCACGATKSE